MLKLLSQIIQMSSRTFPEAWVHTKAVKHPKPIKIPNLKFMFANKI